MFRVLIVLSFISFVSHAQMLSSGGMTLHWPPREALGPQLGTVTLMSHGYRLDTAMGMDWEAYAADPDVYRPMIDARSIQNFRSTEIRRVLDRYFLLLARVFLNGFEWSLSLYGQ